MLVVVTGNAAQSVRTEELGFIEHSMENATQALRVYQRPYSSVVIAALAGTGGMDSFEQLGHFGESLQEVSRHFRHPITLPGLDDGRGRERKKTDERSDFHALRRRIG